MNELLKLHPDSAYLEKAIILVQKTLLNLQYELRYAIPPAKPIKYMAYYRWSDSVVNFVELIYALIDNKSIEYGNVKINEFASYLGSILGVDIKDANDTYTASIKRRKTDSRTHFLDRLTYVLNKKMDIEDKLDPPTPPENYDRTLFD